MSDWASSGVGCMRKKSCQRQDSRVRTQFETLGNAGTAILQDISYSGAQLGETSTLPEIGSEITLYVFLQPINPIELGGTVVRHTENGFAIEYKDVNPEIRRLVDDAAAIVQAPKEG